MKETLSDKIGIEIEGAGVIDGVIKEKDVREFIQRLKEMIMMSHSQLEILKEIDKLAGEELTNHSPQTKPNNIGNPSKRINEIGVGCKSRDKTEDVSNIDKEKEVKTNG